MLAMDCAIRRIPRGMIGGTMRRAILVALGTMTLVSSATAIRFSAADVSDAGRMGIGEYRVAHASIALARSAALERCASLQRTEARDSCEAAALAREAARVAEVESGFRASEQSARAMQRARIELRYQAERARCAPLGGPQRDQCLIAAHALKGRALLDSASPYQTGS
jgi:hypothetical protein